MSENGKDNNNFEFIKEQVVVKKRKKIKRILFQVITTVFMAVLFGIIATATFIIAEPRLYKNLHKDEETKTPVSFPTDIPEGPDTDTISPTGTEGEVTKAPEVKEQEPTPEPDKIFIPEKIEANLDDFITMNEDIRSVAYEVNKSVLNITSIISVTDIFGNSVEKTVNTTGLVIYNNTKEYLILVSLDKVQDANSIEVVFSESMTAKAVLQDYESDLNLAIIAVDIKSIPEMYINNIQVATLGESWAVTVGAPIIALGSPNGHTNSMEVGYVTSKGSFASITDNRLDLFNTSIQDYKDSDGYIVNLKGEVIGLITRTLKEDINKELNTVIGISKIKPIITLMGNQESRIYFGVLADDMTEATKKEHDITSGIYVNEVQANSPAYEAGMQNGDIIMQIDERTILNTNDFYNAISSYKPGDKITAKIKRSNGTNEREMSLSVVLKEKEKEK